MHVCCGKCDLQLSNWFHIVARKGDKMFYLCFTPKYGSIVKQSHFRIMSTAKFKVVIRLEKMSKSTNEAPVCLRITKDRKTTYKTLIHVAPNCWDPKRQCVVHHENADVLNAIIAQKRASMEKETCLLALSHEDVSIFTIRNKINDNLSLDFFEYARKYGESLQSGGNYGTYKRLKSVVKKLQEFVKRDQLPIRNITEEFIRKYERHLATEKNNCKNTITVNMRFIAKLVRDIYRNYDLDETSNPFRKIKFGFESTSREYLTAEEVVKVRDLKLNLYSPLYETRDVFVFECYTGLRISDILTLKWGNISENAITLRMRKTDKLITIPLQNDVRAILDKRRSIIQRYRSGNLTNEYVFGFLKIKENTSTAQEMLNAISSSTAMINKRLKRIMKLAGIEKTISTHNGRHSFATMLLTGKVDLPVIQELLGHHDVKVTQIYAKVVSTRKEEAISVLNAM